MRKLALLLLGLALLPLAACSQKIPDGNADKREVARVRWQNVFELGQWQERLRFLEKRPDGSGYEFTLRREE